MTDSVNVFPPFWQFSDANGDPVSGGMIEFYAAGSSTPRTVYSDSGLTTAIGTTVYCDSAGYPVASSASSTKVVVYTGTTAYKAVFKTASGTTLGTLDNIKGALDTSSYGVTTARPIGNVVAKAATSWSASSSDGSGTLYNANCTGGSQAASLPDAVTVGNGYMLGIRHDGQGSPDTVTYQTVSGQAIKEGHASTTVTSGTLTGYGQTVWLISDGAGWSVYAHVPALSRKGELLQVTDRLTAAPASPVAGAVYLINGTPAGTWLALGLAENNLVQASGIGTWTKLGISTGMLVFVLDEEVNYQWTGSEWEAWGNIVAPPVDYVKKAIFTYQQTSGTAGGTATTGSWLTYPIATFVNSADDNVITGAALASNKISGLPTGWYAINGSGVFKYTNATQLRLYNVTTSAEVVLGNIVLASTDGANYYASASAPLSGVFEVTDAAHEYLIQYRVTRTQTTSGLGEASSWGVEVYGKFELTQLASIQGPQGASGAQGATGRDAGVGRWTFSTSTSSGPSTGTFRFNSATLGSITNLYIHESDADGRALAAFLALFDDATSTTRGTLCFAKESNAGVFITVQVTGAITDNGADITVPVTYVAGALPSNADSMMMMAFGQTGDRGADGATGAAAPVVIDYSLDPSSTADSDPGSGKLRPNHATAASVTTFYFDDMDRLGNSQAAELATWDDSTSSGVKGKLYIVDMTTPANRWTYDVTAYTAASGYSKVTVTHRAGAAAWPTGNVGLLFVPRGDKGADGAGTGDMVAANNLSDVANAATAFGNIKQAATDIATGVVELATTAEVVTGSDTTRAVTAAGVAAALAKQSEIIVVAVSDETTTITTGMAKVTFRMPFAMTLTAVRASLSTVSSSGNPTVNIKEAGSTILSTKLSIDANEKTSTTAATAAVISDATLADDAEITIDIDTAGTGAKGLKVYMIGTRT